jgi:hypothetical protein
MRPVPNETAVLRPRAALKSRWLLISVLVIALLLVGVYDELMHSFLTAVWQRALGAAGLSQQANALQSGINGGITKRFLPAVATYAAVYLGICLLLLRLLLPSRVQWRLVLQLYAGTIVAYVGMVLLTKLAGNPPWGFLLSRQILDFLVSPLPVAGLYVLLRAGFGPRQLT